MNELLELIDQIEQESVFAEMEVCTSLVNVYSKSAMILENCSSEEVPGYEIFQEGERWDRVKKAGSEALKEAKGDKSENIIIRILKFIPRLIAAFIRNLRSSKKTVEKKMKDVEAMRDALVDTIEHPEENTVSQKPETTSQEPETTQGIPQGDPYGDDDKAKRARARAERRARKNKRTSKSSVVFALPMKGDWDRDYRFYVDRDIRVRINDGVIQYVLMLNKEGIDFGSFIFPTQNAIEEIGKALLIRTENGREVLDDEKMNANENLYYSARKNQRFNGAFELDSNAKQIDEYITKAEQQLNHTLAEEQTARMRMEQSKPSDCMISEIIKHYRVMLDWMAYVEKIMKVAQNQIKRITDKLSESTGFEKNLTSPVTGKMSTASISSITRERFVGWTNRCQKIMVGAEKIYGQIITVAYKNLDRLGDAIIAEAKNAGIQILNNKDAKRSSVHFAGIRSGETLGNVNGGYMAKNKKIVYDNE